MTRSYHGRGDTGLAPFVATPCELDGHHWRVVSKLALEEIAATRILFECVRCGHTTARDLPTGGPWLDGR